MWDHDERMKWKTLEMDSTLEPPEGARTADTSILVP